MESVSDPERRVVFSASVWEPQVGFSRGVRVGELVFVSGCVAADGDGKPQGADAYQQTDYILRKIQTTLRQLDADLEDVVSTTTHLADFAYFDDYARAFQHYLGAITPVNTTVQARLVRPEFLVEISAIAVVR